MANIITDKYKPGQMRLAELLNAVVDNIYYSVSRELGSVADRVNSCSSDNYVMDHMNKLASKQEECLNEL